MADATYTFSSTGADKIERDASRAEKAINRTRGSSMKGGMAVLELSRGIEDFAMAGMKGAMNNIPGLLMHLGVGMGLTGALSMVAVAAWQGSKALKAYAESQDELQAQRNANTGIGLIDLDTFGKQFSDQAIAKAKEMESVMSSMQEAQSFISNSTKLASNERNAQMQLDNAKEMLELTIKGATEEEKRYALMMQRVAAEKESAKSARESAKARADELEQLKGMRKGQQDMLDAMPQKDIDFINQKQAEAYRDEYKSLMARGGVTDYQAAKRAQARADSVQGIRIDSMFGGKDQFKEMVRKREEAKAALEILDKQIEKQSILLEKEKDAADSAETIARIKQEQLNIEEQMAANESRIKNEEAMRKSAFKQESVDISNMISSQGRAGLSGNETKAAMDVLNIAKQQLTALKQIARNTLRRTTVYA